MKDIALKILILENGTNDFELILQELKKADFDFTHRHCESESESVFKKCILEFNPDVILSNHNLPSFTSVDALIEARNHNPNIPFILISDAIDEDKAVDLIVNKGFNDFILKISLHRLNPSIIREVNSYNLKNELEKKANEMQRLSLVASHTHNGVVVANDKGEIEWVNEAYTRLTGYTLNECVGLKPGSLLQGKETDSETISRIRKKLKKRIPFREEILNYNKNGTSYWIRLDITAIIDDYGKLTNYIAIQEDITEQKEFEFKLIQAYERLQRAQKIGEIGNWDFDLQSKKLDWSNQVFEIYERDISLGNPTFEEVIGYHINDKLSYKIMNEALEKRVPYDVDSEILTKTGKRKFIRTVGIPVKDDTGKVIRFTGVVQDITVRKKIELAHLDNEQKLKSITDNLPGVVLRYKLYKDGRQELEFISEAVESIFEIPQKLALENCNNLWSLIIPEDEEKTFQSILDSAENLSTWDQVYRIRTKSGKLKWMHAIGVPKEKNKDFVVWDTMILEKTKEIEIENSLKESNTRLLEAQRLAKIGDWYIDFEKNETFSSPTLKTVLGVDSEFEFDIEKGLSFFKEGYDRNRKRLVMEKAVKEGTPYSEELQVVSTDGVVKWVRSIGQAEHKNNKCVRIFGTILDITEEKVLKDSLLKNEQRLNAAIKGANLGVWDANLKEKTVVVNDRWYEMLGYKPDEVDDNYALFFSSLHPNDLDQISNEISMIKAGEKEGFELVLRVKSKSGKYRTILDKGTAMEYDSKGSVVRMIGTHLDITQQEKLRKKIEASLNEKTILLSEIHHRVKNNLAIVSGLLELQAIESEALEVEQILKDMAKRIKSIAGVHELLYDSKSFSEISFKKYVSNLFRTLNSTVSGNFKVNVSLNIEENLAVNINQAVPLGLLINELVTNSYKYAFVRTDNPTIQFSISFDGERYHAIYFDNGLGFDRKEFVTPSSLGITLIKTLLAQLGAEYELNTDNQFKLSYSFRQKILGSHSNI